MGRVRFPTEFDLGVHSSPALDCQLACELDPEQNIRTKQSFLDEVNINNIVKRYISTGELPNVRRDSPLYGIQPNLDLHTAATVLAQAKSDFQLLPPELRAKIGDFSRFEDYVRDPRNASELSELGLIEVVPSAPPASVPVATPVSSPVSTTTTTTT